MSLSNEIILRPRFKHEVNEDNEALLSLFEHSKTTQKDFIVSRVDDHVFIRIPKEKQHFWSPQLHLEINKNEDKKTSTIHGLFGPNPTIWTLFMFLHFIVICLFIGFGTWAYANWSLQNNYSIQLTLAFIMVIIWFALYFSGRLGKSKGNAEMHLLNNFMNGVLKKP